MARKPRTNVGIIGLGIIGTRVANALRGAGFPTFVWNRTPRPEPNFLSSPAEIADVCDVIQIFVADATALFEVIGAFGDLLSERHTIICNATIGPEATIEAAKLVRESGAKFLDAPFTGSKLAAENRQLTYFIGGSDEVLRDVEPVLRASSKAIVKIGEIGQAAVVKIATNMMVAVSLQSLVEAFAVVKKSGVDPEALGAALEHHGIRSALTDLKLPRVIRGDYEPHFSLRNMFKDAQIAIHMANTIGLEIPTTTATAGVMYGGLSQGWGDLDFTATAKVYETEEEAARAAQREAAKAAPHPAPDSTPKTASATEVQSAHSTGKTSESKNGEPVKPADFSASEKSETTEVRKSTESATDPTGKPSIDVEAVVVGKIGDTDPADKAKAAKVEEKPGHLLKSVRRWFNSKDQD